MNIKKIIDDLNEFRDEIVEKLREKDWRHFRLYFEITEKFRERKIEEEFKRVFCNFYRTRGLAGDPKKEFFKILWSKKKDDFEEVLRDLHKAGREKDKQKLFLSFVTKLLHTKNTNLPIYDGNIASVLELPSQRQSAKLEEKIRNRVEIYEELKSDFDVLLKDGNIKEYLNGIRKELSSIAKNDKFEWKDDLISDKKLLDSLLWALHPIEKNK